MENKSKEFFNDKILFTVLIILVSGSIVFSFYKIIIQKDYQVIAETSCQPDLEKCFGYVCDPTSDSSCPAEESERTVYYKIISKKASTIFLCESSVDKNGCDIELTCTKNEKSCSYIFCDSKNLSGEEFCSK